MNYFVVSILASFGLAILLTEKGKEWPIKKYRIYLQLLLRKIHYKAPQMLLCTLCTSFWCAFFIDSCLFFISKGNYFLWPLSGFATCGCYWMIIEFLNAIDKDSVINILPETNKEEVKNDFSNKMDNIIKECSDKNWDGYGAEPIDKDYKDIVEKLLNAFPQYIPTPDILPEPDGEISLEWNISKNKVFYISINKNNKLSYAYINNGKKSTGVGIFDKNIPETIILQLNEFLDY